MPLWGLTFGLKNKFLKQNQMCEVQLLPVKLYQSKLLVFGQAFLSLGITGLSVATL